MPIPQPEGLQLLPWLWVPAVALALEQAVPMAVPFL